MGAATACIEAAGWPEPVRVAVNLSPAQLDGYDILAIIEDALHQPGLPAFRLEIEITEAVVPKDGEDTRDLLRRLHALGVRIALDDFGAGYSSLAYLRALPLNKVKIDRSFVRDLEGSNTAIAIVRAITTLGASLGLATTAEGVETETQLTQLRALGCTEAQGYLFGRPRPGAEVSPGVTDACRNPGQPWTSAGQPHSRDRLTGLMISSKGPASTGRPDPDTEG